MIVDESGIEFDFGLAADLARHDVVQALGDGNTFWKGVDFRVKLQDQSNLWIEVKSWNPVRQPPSRRGANVNRFRSELKSDSFWDGLMSKFLGTTAFLAWTNQFVVSDTTFVVLIEPPRRVDVALLGSLKTRLDGRFPRRNSPFAARISAAVLDLEDWNRFYPDFPAKTEKQTKT